MFSYKLFDYPVVLHLDLDTLVLKSMDDVFDLMITDQPTYQQRRLFGQKYSMWYKNETTTNPTIPERIDFMFTRDYNMVEPPGLQVHQMGVQGGFLLVRPNQNDFDRMVDIIMNGGDGYTIDDGWGGPTKAFGGYYGAGTIQGLASYYYGHYENYTRSVELNRCYFNNMADNPYSFNKDLNKTLCTTLEPDLTCQNCRDTPLDQIYTSHFTVCGKPDWCQMWDPENNQGRLCMELFREWHKVRLVSSS